MQTLTQGLAHLLGRPDTSLLSIYYRYDKRHEEYFAARLTVERPFQELLGYDDRHYDEAVQNLFLDLDKSGFTPQGVPVYSISYLTMLSNNEAGEFARFLRTTDSPSLRSALYEHLKTDNRFQSFNFGSSYVSSRTNSSLVFDEMLIPYNIQVDFNPLKLDHMLRSPDTFHKIRSYFSIERIDEVFHFTHNAVMANIVDGKINVEVLRLAAVSIPQLFEWQKDRSLRVFTYLNPKGKVSKTSHLDTFFRLPGTNQTLNYVDVNGNALSLSSKSFEHIPYIIDPSFFVSNLARFSGLSEHPSFRTYRDFSDLSFEEERILHDVFSSFHQDITSEHVRNVSNRFVRELNLYLSGDPNAEHAASHTFISLRSDRFKILRPIVQAVFTEEDWAAAENTPLEYFRPDTDTSGPGRIPMSAFTRSQHKRILVRLLEHREYFIRTEDGVPYSPGSYILKHAVQNTLISGFSFSLPKDGVSKIFGLHMRSTSSYSRGEDLSSIIAYLLFWNQNPAIEQVVKDKNNLHLSRQYYDHLTPLPEKTQTSSIRALGLDTEARNFLKPLEQLLTCSKDFLKFDIQHKNLVKELQTMRDNGFSLNREFQEAFEVICPSLFNPNSHVEKPSPRQVYTIEQEIRLFYQLLSCSREVIPVHPVTLHNYAQRIDLVQAVAYPNALLVWRDYVSMKQQVMGDDSFELFPSRSLRMAHDIARRQLETIKNDVDKELFQQTMKRWRALGLERNSQNHVILLPKEPQDIIEEGIVLDHCVGSYVNRAAKGETIILFLRKKDAPDHPYITLEINPTHNLLVQAEGRNRRGYQHAPNDAVLLVRVLLDDISNMAPLAQS